MLKMLEIFWKVLLFWVTFIWEPEEKYKQCEHQQSKKSKLRFIKNLKPQELIGRSVFEIIYVFQLSLDVEQKLLDFEWETLGTVAQSAFFVSKGKIWVQKREHVYSKIAKST